MVSLKKCNMINNNFDRNITFLIQGSIDNNFLINEVIKSVRKFYPNSTVLLSTWESSNYKNLNYDQIVLSRDTDLTYKFYSDSNIINNINRQIITTKNGLNQVRTKYVVKIRSDIILTSSSLLDSFKNLKKISLFGLKNQIILPIDLSRNPSKMKMLFHFNDWLIAGVTPDIKKIFDIPLMSLVDLKFFNNSLESKEIYTFKNWINNNFVMQTLKNSMIPRHCPEQYLFKFLIPNYKRFFNNAYSYNEYLLKSHKIFLDLCIFPIFYKNIFINIKHPLKFYSERTVNYTKADVLSKQNSVFLPTFDFLYYFFKFISFLKLLLYKFLLK